MKEHLAHVEMMPFPVTCCQTRQARHDYRWSYLEWKWWFSWLKVKGLLFIINKYPSNLPTVISFHLCLPCLPCSSGRWYRVKFLTSLPCGMRSLFLRGWICETFNRVTIVTAKRISLGSFEFAQVAFAFNWHIRCLASKHLRFIDKSLR